MRLSYFVGILLSAEAFQSFQSSAAPKRRQHLHHCRPVDAVRATSESTALHMEPAAIAAGSVVAAGAAVIWLNGAENRRWRAQLAENEQKER